MLHILLVVLGFVLLLVGTYTDFEFREVPDWVNYGVIFSAVVLRLLFAVLKNDVSYITSGVIGFGIFFSIGMAMFYLGQWGGGDSKLMMGLGILLGFEPSVQYFSIAFLFNIIIVGALYGLAWSLYIATQHWKTFIRTSRKLLRQRTYFLMKVVSGIIALVFIALSFFLQSFQRLALVILGVGVFGFYYLYIYVKAIEVCCMYKYIHPEQLTEGDWIAKDIKVKGKVIAGPKDLGIEKKQINTLKKLHRQGKIRMVKIKEGIPFVPNFLIAYVITFFWGNLIVVLL